MNKLKLITLIFFTVILGCKKDKDTTPATPAPTADFSSTYAGFYAPATVTFTNTSANATSYAWEFGDNGTSTATSPQHIYTSDGLYIVRLTATGAGGTNSTAKIVNILSAPTTAKITYIKCTSYPPDDAGTPWDTADAPDIFFQVQDQGSNVLADFSASVFQDISLTALPIQLNLSNPYVVPSLTTNYFIELWDYDTFDPNDNMGYVGFNMSTYTTYPSSINIINGTISITLGIIWQ